jgi:hypothetical protein
VSERSERASLDEDENTSRATTKLTLNYSTQFVFCTFFARRSVPNKIANMGMSGALDQVYKAYKYFQRDEEIDELEVSLIEMIIYAQGSTDNII